MLRSSSINNMVGVDFDPLTAPVEIVLDNEIHRTDSLIQIFLDFGWGAHDEAVDLQKWRNDLLSDLENVGWNQTYV